MATTAVAKMAAGNPRLKCMTEGYLSRANLSSGRGTVQSVLPVTTRLQRETPLHPAAAELLNATFERGWADPTKIHLESRRQAILLQEAKESLANHLGIKAAELHFLGEPNLGFHLGISALLNNSSRLVHSTIDRQEVFAVAADFHNRGGQSLKLECDLTGLLSPYKTEVDDVLVWQSINAETGICRTLSQLPQSELTSLFIDNTTALAALPVLWSTALWDSKSWRGPGGIAILAISETATWTNPLPSIDHRALPDSFSIPLALASAVALEHWIKDEKETASKVEAMNQHVRDFLKKSIPDCDVAGEIENTRTALICASFLYVDAERLMTALEEAGFSVDSGSACTSTNLQASHVLVAMGLLTQGNIRIHLHHDLTWKALEDFLSALETVVAKLRA